MKHLRVLHVSDNDRMGGACRAAYRIHCALRAQGVASAMLTAKQYTGDQDVSGATTTVSRTWAELRNFLSWPLHRARGGTRIIPYSFNIVPSPAMLRRINSADVDLVHLHWINKEMLSVPAVRKINRPVVCTLHDSWMLWGAEHHPTTRLAAATLMDSEGRPVVPAPTSAENLLNRYFARRKRRAWSGRHMHAACPSHWMAEMAEQSVIFGPQRTHVLPNAVDCDLYRPIGKAIARDILGLDGDSKVLLFGAVDSTSNPLKGYSQLQEILQELAARRGTQGLRIVVFGAASGAQLAGFPTSYAGHLNDELSLALLYSAADLYIAPSLVENLPNTIMEAAACGLPGVAFDVGGTADLIRDGETGCLVAPFRTAEFAQAVIRLLDAADYREISRAARARMVEHFSFPVVARQYVELYERCLETA